MRAVLFLICLVFPYAAVEDAFGSDKPEISGASNDILSLLPHDTIYLFHLPSFARFNELFFASHERQLTSGLISDLAKIASTNKALINRPDIALPPEMGGVLGVVLQAIDGSFASSISPTAKPGALEYLFIGQGIREKDAGKVCRNALAKSLKGTWTPLASPNRWRLKSEVAVLYFSAIGDRILVGTDEDAFMAACQAQSEGKAMSSSLIEDAQFRTMQRQQLPEYLLLNYTSVDRLREWLMASPKSNDKSFGEFLTSKLGGLKGVSWTWQSKGHGSIGNDYFVYQMDEPSYAQFSAIVRTVAPLPVNKLPGDFLTAAEINIDLKAASKMPILAGLLAQRWLQNWSQVPGLGEILYVVRSGKEEGTAICGFRVSTSQPDKLASGGNSGSALLDLSPIPSTWARLPTTGSVWLSPRKQDAESWGRQWEGDSPAAIHTGLSAFLDATQVDQETVFIDRLINRPLIYERAIAVAQSHKEELIGILNKKGVNVPKDFSNLAEIPKQVGWSRSQYFLKENAFILKHSIQLTTVNSSTYSSEGIVTSALFEDEMFQYLHAWQSAALPEGAPPTPENLFNVIAWSNVLVSPSISNQGLPFSFIDNLGEQMLTAPPLHQKDGAQP